MSTGIPNQQPDVIYDNFNTYFNIHHHQTKRVKTIDLKELCTLTTIKNNFEFCLGT